MLVLRRYPGERIVIGTGPNRITVTLLEVASRGLGIARLAVEGPEGISVRAAEDCCPLCVSPELLGQAVRLGKVCEEHGKEPTNGQPMA